jgi:hypothetical protein
MRIPGPVGVAADNDVMPATSVGYASAYILRNGGTAAADPVESDGIERSRYGGGGGNGGRRGVVERFVLLPERIGCCSPLSDGGSHLGDAMGSER